jgi:hypothetical protein
VRIPEAATKEEVEVVEAGMWRKVAVGARERRVMEAMAAVGAACDLRVWIEADN